MLQVMQYFGTVQVASLQRCPLGEPKVAPHMVHCSGVVQVASSQSWLQVVGEGISFSVGSVATGVVWGTVGSSVAGGLVGSSAEGGIVAGGSVGATVCSAMEGGTDSVGSVSDGAESAGAVGAIVGPESGSVEESVFSSGYCVMLSEDSVDEEVGAVFVG